MACGLRSSRPSRPPPGARPSWDGRAPERPPRAARLASRFDTLRLTHARQQGHRPRTLRSAGRSKGYSVAESFAKARFLTVQAVATLMRASSLTVYRLIKAGDLPAVRVGRSFRVRDVDVDAYLESRFTQAG